jgi:hypothetical protein
MSLKDKKKPDGALKATAVSRRITAIQRNLELIPHDLSRLDSDALIAASRLIHNIKCRSYRDRLEEEANHD